MTKRTLTLGVRVDTDAEADVDATLARLAVGTANMVRVILEARFVCRRVEVSVETPQRLGDELGGTVELETKL